MLFSPLSSLIPPTSHAHKLVHICHTYSRLAIKHAAHIWLLTLYWLLSNWSVDFMLKVVALYSLVNTFTTTEEYSLQYKTSTLWIVQVTMASKNPNNAEVPILESSVDIEFHMMSILASFQTVKWFHREKTF